LVAVYSGLRPTAVATQVIVVVMIGVCRSRQAGISTDRIGRELADLPVMQLRMDERAMLAMPGAPDFPFG